MAGFGSPYMSMNFVPIMFSGRFPVYVSGSSIRRRKKNNSKDWAIYTIQIHTIQTIEIWYFRKYRMHDKYVNAGLALLMRKFHIQCNHSIPAVWLKIRTCKWCRILPTSSMQMLRLQQELCIFRRFRIWARLQVMHTNRFSCR